MSESLTDGELRAMQSLVQDAWAVAGPKVRHHVGDLAWGRIFATDSRFALWREDGRVVAWGWLHGGTALDFEIDPRRPELLPEVLAWAGPEVRTTVLESNDAVADALRSHGYAREDGSPWFAHMQRDLDALPDLQLADGFTARSVRGEDELAARTAVHRASWEPSTVTEEMVRTTMRTWPYRSDLDCVVVGPNGAFASYTLAWLDEANRVGEFEPVGTVPSERRRGLGRAANVYALHRLRDAGAETAIVYCRGDADYPIPKLLYESVGFRQHDRTVTWVCTSA